MTEHTPEPWTIHWTWDECGKSSPVVGRDDRLHEPIAIIPHDDVTEVGEPVMRANGHLVIQAPILYRENKELREQVERLRAACRGLRTALEVPVHPKSAYCKNAIAAANAALADTEPKAAP